MTLVILGTRHRIYEREMEVLEELRYVCANDLIVKKVAESQVVPGKFLHIKDEASYLRCEKSSKCLGKKSLNYSRRQVQAAGRAKLDGGICPKIDGLKTKVSKLTEETIF